MLLEHLTLREGVARLVHQFALRTTQASLFPPCVPYSNNHEALSQKERCVRRIASRLRLLMSHVPGVGVAVVGTLAGKLSMPVVFCTIRRKINHTSETHIIEKQHFLFPKRVSEFTCTTPPPPPYSYSAACGSCIWDRDPG